MVVDVKFCSTQLLISPDELELPPVPPGMK